MEERRTPNDSATPAGAGEVVPPLAGPEAARTTSPEATAALSSSLESGTEIEKSDEMNRSKKVNKKVNKKAKKKANKDRDKRSDGLGTSRGIETMFRTSYQTHNALTALADNKANIMISVNGIIISILIASIAPGLGDSIWLMIPTAVLLLGALTSMVFAVLAARPRVRRKTVTLEDVLNGKYNILFFGNFVGMTEEDYVEGMQALMRNTDQVYLNMTRDIYSLGGVLERKFRLLKISYTAFMVGLVAGVLLLLAAYGLTGAAIL